MRFLYNVELEYVRALISNNLYTFFKRFWKIIKCYLLNFHIRTKFLVPAAEMPATEDLHIEAFIMMTSWNGYIFRVTGHLCGEFTGHRWIPRT